MHETAASADPAVGAPDWETIGEHVTCPICSYDLRGLVEPRCPECGYTFTWPGLFSARHGTHRYLFEHHPRRNVRSFLRTSLATWFPLRFWNKLSAAHEVRPRRLVRYWVATSIPVAIVLAALIGLETWAYYQRNTGVGQAVLVTLKTAPLWTPNYDDYQAILGRYGSAEAYVKERYPDPGVGGSLWFAWRTYRPLVLIYAAWIGWPWILGTALAVYRGSLQQVAVRRWQVGRCVLYASDAVFWPGVALLGYVAWNWANGIWRSIQGGFAATLFWRGLPNDALPLAVTALHALILISIYRVTVAYACYLRLRRAWLAVPLAGVAGVLLLWVLYVNFVSPDALAWLPVWR